MHYNGIKEYLHKITELLQERKVPTINYSISLRDACHCKSQQRGQIKFKTAGQLQIFTKGFHRLSA